MKIIFHCSDSTYGNAALLTKWHLQRGWRTIGYHYIILNGQLDSNCYNKNFDGWLETGRALDDNYQLDEWERGAHVKGWNENSIGVCMIGRSGKFTASQYNTAKMTVEFLNEKFFESSVWQHGDFDPKKHWCAGLTKEYLDYIRGE